MRPSNSDFPTIRGLRCHVRLWGPVDAPRLFLLHGWMDVSATFQFLVDAFRREWRVIAPDWRGFGLSAWTDDAYWFPDYLGDLDAILERYSPDEPARLIGHSMGGNVACLYAGIRPERVKRVATLEGFGLAATPPDTAPTKYRKWLEQLRGTPTFGSYASREELAARLRRDNPRLNEGQARFLAQHLGVEMQGGQIGIAGDPYHKVVNPILYRLEEAMACWRQVQASVLWVAGRESPILRHLRIENCEERLACFRDACEVIIEDAGHNPHHDQPQRLADVLEAFLCDE